MESIEFKLREKLILVTFVLSTFTVVILPKSIVLPVFILQIIFLIYFSINKTALLRETWFWCLFLASQIWLPWPLSYIFPIIVFMTWLLISHRGSEARSWISLGKTDFRSLLGATVLVLGTSISLVTWYFLAKPDVSDLRRMVPTDSVLVILGIGFLFSVFNALWEEITFKSILWNSMNRLGISVKSIIGFQGILFGLVHLNGFPRGWAGAGLAAVYGIGVGFLKARTKTLGLPVIVHFFADATIFAILVMSLPSR